MKRLTRKQFIEYIEGHYPCGSGLRWLKRQRSPGEAYAAARRSPEKIDWARWLIGEVFGYSLVGADPAARRACDGDCYYASAENLRAHFPWKRIAAEILKQIGARS